MAIQMRRGDVADLNRDKLRPGEWAICTDGTIVICYASGRTVDVVTKNNIDKHVLKIENSGNDVYKIYYSDNSTEELTIKSGVEVDNTLTVSGKAADAKITGDRLNKIDDALADLQSGGEQGTLGYVSYKMFGAKGDGITNDYEAIRLCHEYANDNDIPVINFGGQYYVVIPESIQLKTDLIFYSGGFVFDNNTFITNTFFRIEPDEIEDDIITTLNNIFDTNNTVVDSLVGKSFNVKFNNDALSHVWEDGSKRILGFPCLAFGKKCYFPLEGYDELKNEEVTITNIQPLKKNITLEGFSLLYHSTQYRRFANVQRNNVTFSNIYFLADNIETSPLFDILYVHDCSNFTLKDSVFIDDRYYTSSEYGYFLQMNYVTNTIIDNITSKMMWRSLGTNYINGLKMINCKTERFDTHYMMVGEIELVGCEFSKFIEIGYGFGKITIRNCVMHKSIIQRTEIPAVYYGDIYVDDCICTDDDLFYFTNYGNSGLSGYLATYNGQGDIYVSRTKVANFMICAKNTDNNFTKKSKITISECENVKVRSGTSGGLCVRYIDCKNVLISSYNYNTFCERSEVIISSYLDEFTHNLYAKNSIVNEEQWTKGEVTLVLEGCKYNSSRDGMTGGIRILNGCTGKLPIHGTVIANGGMFDGKAGYTNTGAGVVANALINSGVEDLKTNKRITKINVVRLTNNEILNETGTEEYSYPDLSWIDEQLIS